MTGAAGVVFDSGALIAFERRQRDVVALVARANERTARIVVPAGVVAQVWRDGARQVWLARLLASDAVEVVPLLDQDARAVGQMLGVTGTTDVVDASVVWCAKQRDQAVVTSDPDDLRALGKGLRILLC